MSHAEVSLKARELGLPPKEELFCYALVDNGEKKQEAAITAGYAEKSAHVTASRLLNKKRIQEFLAFIRGQVASSAIASAEEVLERYTRIARADPNELVASVIGCCRYCWGQDHEYQYTPAEFAEEQREWETKRDRLEKAGKGNEVPLPPSAIGGLDFNRTKSPNPECPECNGLGEHRAQPLDSRNLSPEALELFAGIKQSPGGTEVKFHSKQDALDKLARHHNLFEKEQKAGAGEIHVHLLPADENL